MRKKFRAQYHRKLKVVTAELAKAQEQSQQEKSVSSSVPLEEIPKEAPKPKGQEPTDVSSGGSILVDKTFEPLEAILKAYEARLDKRL